MLVPDEADGAVLAEAGLGAELRELRQQAQLTTREAGERAGWSHAMVSRIEIGKRGITTEEVATLLAIYDVKGEIRERLIQLAREADRPGWWETGEPGLPQQLTALIDFEAQAARITDVAMILVPGLLQIAEYARAVMAAARIPPPIAETRVATRMGRKEVLKGPDAPQLNVLLDEAVLRRPLGGNAVMAAQIRHMIAMGREPNIEVRMLLYAPSGHVALNGSFSALEFEKAPTIVHLQHKLSGLFLDTPKETDVFMTDVTTLRENALDCSDSADFLAAVARTYEG